MGKNAFVLMPFGDAFDIFYYAILKPLLEEIGYEVKRADELKTQQIILKDIIKGINDADLIIADISTSNPNVYYELGISHIMHTPVILITRDEIDDLPFDIGSNRVTRYSMSNFPILEDFSETFEDLATRAFNGKLEYSNPLLDWGYGNLIQKRKEFKERESEDGIYDNIVITNDNLMNMRSTLEIITDKTKKLVGNIETSTNEISILKRDKNPYTPSKVRDTINALAENVDEYSNNVYPEIIKYRDCIDTMFSSSTSVLRRLTVNNQDDYDSLNYLKEAVGNLKIQTIIMAENTSKMRESFKYAKGNTRKLDNAIRGVENTLQELIDCANNSLPLFDKLITLCDEKLKEYKPIQ